jgi:positive regulator of sigma E activity
MEKKNDKCGRRRCRKNIKEGKGNSAVEIETEYGKMKRDEKVKMDMEEKKTIWVNLLPPSSV